MCTSLVGLPNNFGTSVPKLKRLEMIECRNLKTLPNSIGDLTELEHWNLHQCESLTTLPNSIGGLVRLKEMNLSGCSNLKEIPMELGRLTNLEKLSGLDNYICLPNIGELKKLKELRMTAHVPAGFDGLKALSHLYVLEGSEDLSMGLSCSLGALTALQSLHMKRVKELRYIPESLGKLKSLLHIHIEYCTDLWFIRALPQCLEHLNLQGCEMLSEIPSLMPMKSLVHLNLEGCYMLGHIHGLECLTTLEFINMVDCISMTDDGVSINKGNKALRECDLRNCKAGVAYNNGWLEVGLLSLKFYFGVFLDIEPLSRMVAGLGCQFQFHILRSFSSFM